MDTAYKTRAWWMLRALSYFEPICSYEEAVDGARYPRVSRSDIEQHAIWHREGVASASSAMAPAGSECLTRLYVDRRGDLLPEHCAG